MTTTPPRRYVAGHWRKRYLPEGREPAESARDQFSFDSINGRWYIHEWVKGYPVGGEDEQEAEEAREDTEED